MNKGRELSCFVESETDSSNSNPTNVNFERKSRAGEVSEEAKLMLCDKMIAVQNLEEDNRGFQDWRIEIGNMKRIFKTLSYQKFRVMQIIKMKLSHKHFGLCTGGC